MNLPWGDKRPEKYSECLKFERPCPWISCKDHLIWLRSKSFFKKTDNEIVEIISKMKVSCWNDICGKQMTLDEIGKILGTTRERVRQIESGCRLARGGAIGKLKHKSRAKTLKQFL